jgi:hypothetical protein
MAARQNFYTNVFEQIREYRNKKDDTQSTQRGFLNDHLVQLSLVASVLTVAVFGGYFISYPQYLTFSGPRLQTFIAEQKFIAQKLFSADRSFAADGSVTYNGLPVKAADDSYVDSEIPDKSFGSESILRISSAPERSAFVKFRVPSTMSVSKALLYVATAGSLPDDVNVYYIPDNVWSGKLLTYESRPTGLGEKVGVLAAASENQLSIDVSRFVKSGNVVSFSFSKDIGEATLASSESGTGVAPVLIISE